MKKLFIFLLLLPLIFSAQLLSQTKSVDKGIFVKPKEGFYDEILKAIDEFENPEKPPKKSFKLDLSGMDIPTSIDEFETFWYNEPISQGQTGTCWAFATTSFLESEVYRIFGKEIKLSEMFTVYWEYIEKARWFIQERGNSFFSEGSEANAVTRMWSLYGAVPLEIYSGMQPGQKFHNHSKMYNEMNTYLQHIKSINAWNEEEALNNIKAIMNHYMGEPPDKFKFEGKEYSPKEFLSVYLKMNPDDYVSFYSMLQQPYYQKVEYEVPDNWWHSKDYYNVPLDEFMSIVKNTIKKGYSIAIGGDVSEAGYDAYAEAAVVPAFDIPSEYIDEHARQFRFSNGTTTDDHLIHIVGFQERNGTDWFLIKDSGSGSRNGNNKGYYFYHEDYIKLKITMFMVHRNAVVDILKKFNE
jgi:bleomycin hydrolase